MSAADWASSKLVSFWDTVPLWDNVDFFAGFKQAVECVGLALDAAGVLVIVLGVAVAGYRFLVVRMPPGEGYRQLRHDIGRGILLGLELLVAADIIRTVAVDPTLENVLVLGLIVLIRTFLSIALQVELEGRWPWQSNEDGQRPVGVPGGGGNSPAEDSNQ